MTDQRADSPVQNDRRPWSGGGRDELADEVRRLINLTVTSAAPPDVLGEAATTLRALADRLEGHVPGPDPSPTGRFAEEGLSTDGAGGLAGAMPFDVVIGRCNPLAPPLTIEFEPPNAVAHAVFTAPYEGASGCVHGAVLAGAFDIVLTAANVLGGSAGPTRTLSIRYRRPTLIDTPSRFEAWVTSIEGREVRSSGRLLQGGKVCVEAEGHFVNLDRPLIDSMHRRGASAGAGGAAAADGTAGAAGADGAGTDGDDGAGTDGDAGADGDGELPPSGVGR